MCFRTFLLSNRKAHDLYPPENWPPTSGKHSGECENRKFSPAGKKHVSPSNLPPETKKPTRGQVGRESRKWWSWWLCSGTPIAPQNPVFLSIPRSSLALYSTSSTGFRFPFYGEKTGKIPFPGEEMGNFCMPISQSPNREPNLLPCQFEDK